MAGVLVRLVCAVCCHRNAHPTTRLLQPFPGSPRLHLPPGILAVSSRGVLLCTCVGVGLAGAEDAGATAAAATAAVAGEAAAARQAGSSSGAAVQAGVVAGRDAAAGPVTLCIRKQELVQWSLAGQPLSCAAVNDVCWLVGDSRAGEAVCAFVCVCVWVCEFGFVGEVYSETPTTAAPWSGAAGKHPVGAGSKDGSCVQCLTSAVIQPQSLTLKLDQPMGLAGPAKVVWCEFGFGCKVWLCYWLAYWQV